MVREMPGWRPRGFSSNELPAMFVAGRATAMAHGFVRGHGVQKGDVRVTGAGADIDGYHSELERTMFVGEPTAAHERAFDAMLQLQTRAIETMSPGVPAAEVELAVMPPAPEPNVGDELRHPRGQSTRLEAHDAP